ncbi:hypothetical protein L484_021719 [Morus notabilis]|uniref:Uncharacterized protein n=1 Tax=Morus notabilis TaxID=981085 RepID=W9RWB5_9ROSA|nr:hypothetical protein L484_021719 [Morus notabilis]
MDSLSDDNGGGGMEEVGHGDDLLQSTMLLDDTEMVEDAFETQMVDLASETQVTDFRGETQEADICGETQSGERAPEKVDKTAVEMTE